MALWGITDADEAKPKWAVEGGAVDPSNIFAKSYQILPNSFLVALKFLPKSFQDPSNILLNLFQNPSNIPDQGSFKTITPKPAKTLPEFRIPPTHRQNKHQDFHPS